MVTTWAMATYIVETVAEGGLLKGLVGINAGPNQDYFLEFSNKESRIGRAQEAPQAQEQKTKTTRD